MPVFLFFLYRPLQWLCLTCLHIHEISNSSIFLSTFLLINVAASSLSSMQSFHHHNDMHAWLQGHALSDEKKEKKREIKPGEIHCPWWLSYKLAEPEEVRQLRDAKINTFCFGLGGRFTFIWQGRLKTSWNQLDKNVEREFVWYIFSFSWCRSRLFCIELSRLHGGGDLCALYSSEPVHVTVPLWHADRYTVWMVSVRPLSGNKYVPLESTGIVLEEYSGLKCVSSCWCKYNIVLVFLLVFEVLLNGVEGISRANGAQRMIVGEQHAVLQGDFIIRPQQRNVYKQHGCCCSNR